MSWRVSLLSMIASLMLYLTTTTATAGQVLIERFNMSEVDVSLDGIDYHDTFETTSFGSLPILVTDSNSEYLQVVMPDGASIWVMESDVTTTEFNDIKRNCSLARGGDTSLSDQGGVRGVDNPCQK